MPGPVWSRDRLPASWCLAVSSIVSSTARSSAFVRGDEGQIGPRCSVAPRARRSVRRPPRGWPCRRSFCQWREQTRPARGILDMSQELGARCVRLTLCRSRARVARLLAGISAACGSTTTTQQRRNSFCDSDCVVFGRAAMHLLAQLEAGTGGASIRAGTTTHTHLEARRTAGGTGPFLLCGQQTLSRF